MLEQVGVKAPGKANKTIFLFEKIDALETSRHSNGFSPAILSFRVRVLKITAGMFVISWIIAVTALVSDKARI